jgi:hypothetical protein
MNKARQNLRTGTNHFVTDNGIHGSEDLRLRKSDAICKSVVIKLSCFLHETW